MPLHSESGPIRNLRRVACPTHSFIACANGRFGATPNHAACSTMFELEMPPHIAALHRQFLKIPLLRHHSHSNHMTRQQEIRNPLLDRILVLAAPANQLATLHTGLHEKRVQILQSLRRLVVVCHQDFSLGDHVWKTGQAELLEERKYRVSQSDCDAAKEKLSIAKVVDGFRFTSCEIVFRASQLSLGSMFWMSSGLISASTCSSSASLGWRGKAAGFVLQVLRAQQRKLRVRSFILKCVFFS
jgi:hypothetical protein